MRGEMWAFHPRGRWLSRDGKTWSRSELPSSGLNSGYQKYMAFGDAVYALGTMQGNYQDLHLTSRIARTRDFRRWEKPDLAPRRFDGRAYYNDVWNTADGVHWTLVTDHAGWSRRNVDMAVVFKDRIWVIGGGVIDGQPAINPNSQREVWSSADGVHWSKSPDRTGSAWGGAPIVYDDQLWLVASNRNSSFAPSLVVTADGVTWREESAPWSPRGAPAVWVFDNKLFMAGGKYSVMEHGAGNTHSTPATLVAETSVEVARVSTLQHRATQRRSSHFDVATSRLLDVSQPAAHAPCTEAFASTHRSRRARRDDCLLTRRP